MDEPTVNRSLKFVSILLTSVAIIYCLCMFTLHLATFASPGLEVVAALGLVSHAVSPYGRMWFTLANTVFWFCYIWTSSLLCLAINWKNPELLKPFIVWSVISVIFRATNLGFRIASYEGPATGLVIFWEVVNIAFALVSIVIMVKYNRALEKPEDPTSEEELPDESQADDDYSDSNY